jgi:hypothetical protein
VAVDGAITASDEHQDCSLVVNEIDCKSTFSSSQSSLANIKSQRRANSAATPSARARDVYIVETISSRSSIP